MKEVIVNEFDFRKWINFFEICLFFVFSFKVYCFYGVGKFIEWVYYYCFFEFGVFINLNMIIDIVFI